MSTNSPSSNVYSWVMQCHNFIQILQSVLNRLSASLNRQRQYHGLSNKQCIKSTAGSKYVKGTAETVVVNMLKVPLKQNLKKPYHLKLKSKCERRKGYHQMLLVVSYPRLMPSTLFSSQHLYSNYTSVPYNCIYIRDFCLGNCCSNAGTSQTCCNLHIMFLT
jgi:hypothetical protein